MLLDPFFCLSAILFIAGLAVLIRGSFPWPQNRIVADKAARVIGVLLILPGILFFYLFLYFLAYAFGGTWEELGHWVRLLHVSRTFMPILAVLIGLLVAAACAKPRQPQ